MKITKFEFGYVSLVSPFHTLGGPGLRSWDLNGSVSARPLPLKKNQCIQKECWDNKKKGGGYVCVWYVGERVGVVVQVLASGGTACFCSNRTQACRTTSLTRLYPHENRINPPGKRFDFGYILGNEGPHSPRRLISVLHSTSSHHPFLRTHTSSGFLLC